MDNKQAILGFTEFFKGITGNQNLEIPSEIAEKIGLQAQADGDIITALCSLPKIISEDGQDYVQLFDVLETVKRYTAKADDGVAIPPAEPKTGHWEWIQYDSNPNIGNWHCSECRAIILHMPEETDNTPIYKWCPMCGTKMVEPQESEG